MSQTSNEAPTQKPYANWHTPKPWSRHSLILVIAGVAYISTGIAYIFSEQTASREAALVYAIRMMPFEYWGGVFMLVGFVALLASRWPSWPKTFGYTVLTGWSAAWSAFYIVGAMASTAHISYFSTGLIWALVAFMWWAISGLISPGDTGGI